MSENTKKSVICHRIEQLSHCISTPYASKFIPVIAQSYSAIERHYEKKSLDICVR